MKTLLKTLFSFLLATQICFGQWYWQHPLPQGNDLNSVKFISTETGWAVGDVGTILKTVTGGTEWILLTSEITYNLFGVSFIDINKGTAVGSGGTIIRTTDGGSTWVSQSSGTTYDLNSVFFIDADIGTVVGSNGTILRTTNGGVSWVNQTSGTAYDLNSVFFTDANTGTAVGYYGEIFRTINGGLSWIYQYCEFGSYTPNLLGVYFNNESTGTIYGELGTIYRTTDGGSNWISQTSGITQQIKSISFSDEITGTAVAQHGFILRTTNGGSTWINQQNRLFKGILNDVSFSDANSGCAVGTDLDGDILRTTDGGSSWISQSTGTNALLFGVSMIDYNTGTTVGWSGKIFRTTNGGSTWVSQASGTTRYLYDVSFTDINTGTVVGDYGTILRTTNGGSSWISQTSGTSRRFYGVSMIDNNTGIAVGMYGQISRTTDGGLNWVTQTSGTGTLYSVSFTDINTGTAVGSGGTIIRTTDGGVNWVSQISGTTDDLRSISFTDINTGTAVGSGGTIIRTTDGGSSWVSQSSGTNVLLTGVCFINNNLGWISGLWGVILGTTKLTPEAPIFIEPTPLAGSIITAFAGSEINFTIVAEDEDTGDIVTLSGSGLPYGSSMSPVLPTSSNPVSSEFTWLPTSSDVGNYNLTFTATDNSSATVTRSFTIEVINVNTPPLFVTPTPECGSTMNVDVGSSISFTITADDGNEGDVITLSASGLPSSSSMHPALPTYGNPVSSMFTWTPTTDDVGLHVISYIATDNLGEAVSCSLTVEVSDFLPPSSGTCPHSQGYWKNHASNWPVNAVPMQLGTINTYNQLELLSLFNASPRGDASIILVHQLIAAKLNVANGSPIPSEVQNAIEDADAAIGTASIPIGIKANTSLGSILTGLASLMDNYNNNLLTPICMEMYKTHGDQQEPVTEYALFSNYPNPFNPITKISWQAPVSSYQKLKVYDVLSNEVAILVDEFREAGRYDVEFNAEKLSSGIYFYRLQAGEYTAVKKMILIK